ncbi:MAG: hypothetical protein ACQESG_07820 [Nanobdellota archaeon]
MDLLRYLLLEEIRLHSQLRGYRSFSLFPLVLFIGTAMVSFFLIRFSSLSGEFALGSIIIFFMFGIVCGTFGLHATDYLERRFGDYGKLFANTMVLPIRLRHVFLMTAASDMIFYFGWFILPLVGGVAGALLVAGENIAFMPVLLLSITCAFMTGMGASFLLTVALNRSVTLFIFLLVFIGTGLAYVFLPYRLYAEFSLFFFLCNMLVILKLFMLAAHLIGNEFHTRRKGKHHSLRFRGNHLLFKDFVDLYRTHGLFAKPLFNVVIPSALMLFLLGSLTILEGELALVTQNLVFVAILLGTLSINFFNVLLAGDSISYYQFLPLGLRDFLWPKMILAQVICSLQGIVLLLIYGYFAGYAYVGSSFLVLIGFIFYTMCINLFINGLKPNENSLNITSLGLMCILFLPVIITGMVLPFFTGSMIAFVLFSAVLALLGVFFYRLSIRSMLKHDS